MGILNVTPDSFYDGGHYQSVSAALNHAEKMLAEGADIIDVGGESTRPGAQAVSLADELERVIPVIKALRRHTDKPIAIDTYKPEVMQAAIDAGATMINDIFALQKPRALEVAAKLNVPVILMHMQGTPQTMQLAPEYSDLLSQIQIFFQERIAACLAGGIARENLLIDPGFAFGKRVQHNLQIIKHCRVFHTLGYPLCMGVSRKSTIGHVLKHGPADRLAGALALTTLSVFHGAKIIRTHDVAPTRDAVLMTRAVLAS